MNMFYKPDNSYYLTRKYRCLFKGATNSAAKQQNHSDTSEEQGILWGFCYKCSVQFIFPSAWKQSYKETILISFCSFSFVQAVDPELIQFVLRQPMQFGYLFLAVVLFYFDTTFSLGDYRWRSFFAPSCQLQLFLNFFKSQELITYWGVIIP